MTLEEFTRQYVSALQAHRLAHPGRYSPFMNEEKVAKMTINGIQKNSIRIADLDAMRGLMAKLAPKLPYTARDVHEWVDENVRSCPQCTCERKPDDPPCPDPKTGAYLCMEDSTT